MVLSRKQQLAYSGYFCSFCSPTMLCVHTEELMRVRPAGVFWQWLGGSFRAASGVISQLFC